MPVFRYECKKCGVTFNKLVASATNSQATGCTACGAIANKIVTASNFAFHSDRPQGETGVHDIDYPVIDKAVGRSAETRWTDFKDRRDFEDGARKQYGTEYLGKFPVGPHEDQYYKVNDTRLNERREVIREGEQVLFNEAPSTQG